MIDRFSLGTLPAVPFVERNQLPHTSAVYFALSHTGEVLYIGRTFDLRQRWAIHHRLQQLTQLGCQYIAWYAAGRDALEAIEAEMIQEFKPPLNRPWAPPSPQPQYPGKHSLACRLPEDLYQAIQQVVQEGTRPINSQVIVLLREALNMRAKQPAGLTAHGGLTP